MRIPVPSRRAVLHGFFDEPGEEDCAWLEAVSCDLQGAWGEVIRARCPNVRVCADPFQVVKLAGQALDALRRQDWQRLRKEDPRRAAACMSVLARAACRTAGHWARSPGCWPCWWHGWCIARAATYDLLAYRTAYTQALEHQAKPYGLGIAWGAQLQPRATDGVKLCTPDTLPGAIELALA